MSPRAFLPSLALVFLVGCAGPALLSPSDFPSHATDDPFFNLHWRVERENGVVRAVGVVEAARVDGIAEVTLELVGLDASGHVVSRSLGRTIGGRLVRWQARPFSVRLRPVGRETGFDLRVWSFAWEGGRDRGARSGR